MNVVPLNTRPVNSSAVGMLRELLEMAERGELAGMAIAGVLHDGAVVSGWSSGVFNKYTLLGGLEGLKRNYLHHEIQIP